MWCYSRGSGGDYPGVESQLEKESAVRSPHRHSRIAIPGSECRASLRVGGGLFKSQPNRVSDPVPLGQFSLENPARAEF